jgi:hypothetical protein
MDKFIDKLDITNGNTLEITYAKNIDDNIYDVRIPKNVVKNIMPLITSIFHKKANLKQICQLYHTNSYIETSTIKYKNTDYHHITTNLIECEYVVDNSTLIKFNNNQELPYIRFPSCKTYYHKKKFSRLCWDLGNDIIINLDVFQEYGILRIVVNISEEKMIVIEKEKELKKIYEKFNKLIAAMFNS